MTLADEQAIKWLVIAGVGLAVFVAVRGVLSGLSQVGDDIAGIPDDIGQDLSLIPPAVAPQVQAVQTYVPQVTTATGNYISQSASGAMAGDPLSGIEGIPAFVGSMFSDGWDFATTVLSNGLAVAKGGV
jgi:hypothetical protein